VWFADIVGFTGLSSRDEDAALRLVETFQAVTRRVVAECAGSVVKFLGDGGLALFPSAEGAVRAGLAVQRGFPTRTTAAGTAAGLRVGIHLGEVVSAPDEDVYGDGVNTAARIQHEALARANEVHGRRAEALAECEKALGANRGDAFSLGFVGFVHARLGHRRGDQTYYSIAVVHAGLGDRDQALTWLERVYARRSPNLVYLAIDPRLDDLRSDPRYVSLVHRMRLA